MFNTLQLVVYASEIRANLPAHSTIVLAELKRIALFEFIPYKWFTETVKAPFTKDKHMAKFESDSIIDDMGTMIVIGVALFLVIGITVLLAILCRTMNDLCTNVLTMAK